MLAQSARPRVKAKAMPTTQMTTQIAPATESSRRQNHHQGRQIPKHAAATKSSWTTRQMTSQTASATVSSVSSSSSKRPHIHVPIPSFKEEPGETKHQEKSRSESSSKRPRVPGPLEDLQEERQEEAWFREPQECQEEEIELFHRQCLNCGCTTFFAMIVVEITLHSLQCTRCKFYNARN